MNTDRVTIKQFIEKHKIPRTTATLWCRNGVISGAVEEMTIFGKVWLIPRNVYETFESQKNKPTRGRPRHIKEVIAA